MSPDRRAFLSGLATLSVASYANCASLAAVPPGEGPSPALSTSIPLSSPRNALLFSCKYGMIKGQGLEDRLTIAKAAGFDGVDFDDAANVIPTSYAQLNQLVSLSTT